MPQLNPATRLRAAFGTAFAALLLFALSAGLARAQMVEGKNYQRLSTPVPVETGKKIEVIEFFSFGCPHCADLEPILDG